jgi:hypothetical protein
MYDNFFIIIHNIKIIKYLMEYQYYYFKLNYVILNNYKLMNGMYLFTFYQQYLFLNVIIIYFSFIKQHFFKM